MLTRSIIRADQEIADDGVLLITQSRYRHHRREPASVLPDIRKLVDVFDPARSLKDQRFEAGSNLGCQFGTQCLGAGDDFLRIGNISWSNLIHHFGGSVTQHALGADVKDLNDSFSVGSDA